MNPATPSPEPPQGLECAGFPLLAQAGQLFKVLGDPSRLRLLQVLLGSPDPLGPSDLAKQAGLSGSTTSKHLALLVREGLVRRHAKGNQAWFEPVRPLVSQVCAVVCEFVLARSEASWRELQ